MEGVFREIGEAKVGMIMSGLCRRDHPLCKVSLFFLSLVRMQLDNHI